MHVTEGTSPRWLHLASMAHLNPNCTRDNLWVIACALQLRQGSHIVTLLSESPGVYTAYQAEGYLNDIKVLEPGWDDDLCDS